MVHTSKYFLLFLLCIFLSLTIQAIDQKAIVVGIDRVSLSAHQEKIQVIGTIAAREDIIVTSRVTGCITDINFQDGQKVKAGQRLVILDYRFEQARFNEARAKYNEDLRRLKEIKNLFAKKATSKSELDAQKSLVKQSQAVFQAKRVMLDYFTICAPFSGVIGMSKLSKGEYIQEGSPLVRLVSLDKLYVEFNLSSRYLNKIKMGQNLILLFEAWPGKQFAAEVAGVDPVIDVDSRNLKIRANINNSEYLLLPGLLADTSLTLFSYDALSVKTSSVFYRGNTAYVYRVAKDNKAVLCPVLTGKSYGDETLILNGLTIGDRVVSRGVIKVKAGAEIVSDSMPDIINTKKILHKRGV